MKTNPPPLFLYIHAPWCESKCPYCDFNSYAAERTPPEARYVRALLADLECDLAYLRGRELSGVFIGGGTPSLLSGGTVAAILEGVRARAALRDGAEVTLEANPGSADTSKFTRFRQAGVNRLSLGVQSFDDGMLCCIGRAHDAREAKAAFAAARAAGFTDVNLDLMFGLPGQTFAQAAADIEQAISLGPEHISYYQLTIEPNTPFHARPPELPDDEAAWRMETHAQELLRDAGYLRYEVSAYARPGRRCRHNLNYWEFGDYLGIGAGAHAKLTLEDGVVLRLEKHRNPNRYLGAGDACDRRAFCARRRWVIGEEAAFEFMLNALRLTGGFDESAFAERTGVEIESLEPRLSELERRGLLARDGKTLRATGLGMRFLNDVQSAFLHARDGGAGESAVVTQRPGAAA